MIINTSKEQRIKSIKLYCFYDHLVSFMSKGWKHLGQIIFRLFII